MHVSNPLVKQWFIVILNRNAIGPAINSASSIRIQGLILSGPLDLLIFRSSFFTITSVTHNSPTLCSVLLGILGISPSFSLLKTLENCFNRMLAFSSSSNFSDLLSFGLASNGAMPGFVFNLSRVCVQNILGLVLDSRAMPVQMTFSLFVMFLLCSLP